MLKKRFSLGLSLMAALALMSGAAQMVRADDGAKAHGPIAWKESLAEAQKIAAKENKVIFIDFWAEWCGPCKQMLATTYKDKKVVDEAKKFVPVLINVDKQAAIASKYKIEAIPTVIFMDAKGKILLRPEPNAYSPQQFLQLMNEAKKKAKG